MSMKDWSPLTWIAVVLLALGVLVAIVVAAASIGAYNGLVHENQLVKLRQGGFSSALDLGTSKIELVWDATNKFFSHESDVIVNATKYRGQFLEAKKEGNPQKAVDAAMAFNIVVTKEAYPQLTSEPVVQKQINSMEESVNEMKTALDDWNTQIERYNTYRASFPTSIIGNLAGFPSEYEYYKSDKTKFDASAIINK